MITWRGIVRVRQRRHGWRMNAVAIICRFEVYDTEAAGVPLASVTHTYIWPLADLAGLTLAQLANLVLNVGLIRTVQVESPPGFPPLPPVQVGPDPPPLRTVGAAFLQEWLDGRRVLELPLPWVFHE